MSWQEGRTALSGSDCLNLQGSGINGHMIELTFKAPQMTHVDLRNLLPERVCRMSTGDIAALEVYSGNRTVTAGELFDIQTSASGSESPLQINLSGDLQHASNIGAGMTGGRIVVSSSAGNGTGSAMKGGEIVVEGNTGDYTGMSMRGGTIRVSGNCGDSTGAAFPGESSGMNGGNILVSGDAGDSTGSRMRRGVIAIGGNSGRLTGWNMLAGTIIVGESCASAPGDGMKRGTIFCRQCPEPGLLFRKGQSYYPQVAGLLNRWLKNSGYEHCGSLFRETRFRSWFGNELSGFKGELFAATTV